MLFFLTIVSINPERHPPLRIQWASTAYNLKKKMKTGIGKRVNLDQNSPYAWSWLWSRTGEKLGFWEMGFRMRLTSDFGRAGETWCASLISTGCPFSQWSCKTTKYKTTNYETKTRGRKKNISLFLLWDVDPTFSIGVLYFIKLNIKIKR